LPGHEDPACSDNMLHTLQKLLHHFIHFECHPEGQTQFETAAAGVAVGCPVRAAQAACWQPALQPGPVAQAPTLAPHFLALHITAPYNVHRHVPTHHSLAGSRTWCATP
jgi:hypothetical protein